MLQKVMRGVVEVPSEDAVQLSEQATASHSRSHLQLLQHLDRAVPVTATALVALRLLVLLKATTPRDPAATPAAQRRPMNELALDTTASASEGHEGMEAEQGAENLQACLQTMVADQKPLSATEVVILVWWDGVSSM